MNEAHRTQVGYTKDGACSAVSLDGHQNDWLNTKGRGHSGNVGDHIRRRNEELQFWISSSQVTQADEGGLAPSWPQRRSLVSWSKSGRGRQPSWPLPPPSSLTAMPRQLCFLERSKSICHLRDPLGTCQGGGLGVEWEREADWIKLSATEEELYSWIVQNKKEAIVAKPQHTLPMILYADDCPVLPQKLDNTYYPGGDEDSTNGNVGYHTSHASDVCCGLENLNSKWCRVLSLDSPDDGRCEENLSGNRNTATSPTLQNPVGDQRPVRRVSFCDEVLVYLFDQESPTRPQPSLSSVSYDEYPSTPSSYPNNNQDLALDHGFEWEDDFTALDWATPTKTNCPPGREHSDPSPQRFHTLPQQRTPWRYQLPKTCLVLTHVPESDLEEPGAVV
ncbi:unnamed protein product [Boreogadus saida]